MTASRYDAAPPTPRATHKWWIGPLLLLLLLFASLLIFEVAYRALGLRQYFYNSPMMRYDERIGSFMLKPNVHGIIQSHEYDFDVDGNSRGWRDLERDLQKAPGTTRIAIVGDSMVFGYVPFEDTIARQLQQRYAASDVEVLAFGLGSYDPRDYRNVVAQEVILHHPDVVVTTLYVGNDLVNQSQPNSLQVYHGYFVNRGLVDTTYTKTKFWVAIFLKRYVKSYAALYNAYKTLVLRDADNNAVATFYATQYSSNPTGDAYIAQAIDRLLEIDTLLKTQGVRHVVLLLPQKVQFSSDEQFDAAYGAAIRNTPSLSNLTIDLRWPQKAIEAALDENDIAWIDTQESLTLADYYKDDVHLAPAGNGIVAGRIKRWVDANVVGVRPASTIDLER